MLIITMSKLIDLTNQQFNDWKVLSRAPNNSRGETMWLCECKCGTQKNVQGYSLRKGLSKSCGCLQKSIVSAMNFENLIQQTFSHLTVIEYAGKDVSKKNLWKCQCDCKAATIITVRGADLKSGKTTSCGCIKSIGEEKIAFLLNQAHLPFEKEKTFQTCRFPDTGGLARFDFYVNNSYLIEYDGIQHFEPTFNQFNENVFNITKTHDEFKDKWCKQNNIPLIRISYQQLKNLKLEDLII